MARKKKKDEVENYFNNVANYQTEAEARAVTPEGVKVFCAFDELVPIGKVVPNPGNPNTHPPKQVALLAAIIKGQGWRKPITVSKRSGFVVTGHGRLEAAQSMQASVVPVEYQEYASEAEEYADLMADNRLAELSEMNTSALADMLQQMDTGEIPLEMSGYTEEDLEDLLNALGGVDDTENNGEDTVPPPKNIPMTHAGDIWHLGQHRLICGDSTKPETLQKLLGDELAQCVNTDPPYGISLDGGGGNGKRQKQQIENNGMIANDELTDDDLLGKLLIPAFKNAVKYSKPDAAFYIYHATDTRRDFEDAMTAAGLLEKQYLIWLKNNHNLSGTDYLRDFEPMFYAEKAGHTAKWFGDRSNNTCWKITLRDLVQVDTSGIEAAVEQSTASGSEDTTVEKQVNVTTTAGSTDTTPVEEAAQAALSSETNTTDTTMTTNLTVEAGSTDATPAATSAQAELDNTFSNTMQTNGSTDVTIEKASDNIAAVYSQVGSELQAAFNSPYSARASVNVTVSYHITNPSASLSTHSSGSTVSVSIAGHANGGEVGLHGAELSWLGEEGKEYVIPTVPGRRGRGIALWQQAGEDLGVLDSNGEIAAHANGGIVGPGGEELASNTILPLQAQPQDESKSVWSVTGQEMSGDSSEEESEGKKAVSVNAAVQGQQGNNTFEINVDMSPVIKIEGGNMDEEKVFEVMKNRIREMADDLGDEIAERMSKIFANMPLIQEA